jgi:hypothetical protein
MYLIFTTLIVKVGLQTDLSGEQFIMMVSEANSSSLNSLSSLAKLSYGSGAKSSAQSFVPSREILFHAVTC